MVKHSSRIELSLSALKNNYKFIREKIGSHPIISSVVKANAFGHGIETFVPMAEQCGIHHFAVASSFEAWEVKQVCGPESNIMIMGILYPSDLEWVIEQEIEFFVFDYERIILAQKVSEKMGKPAIIHLEVETGGNRTGLSEKELLKTVEVIQSHPHNFVVEGFCTHFAGIEALANQFRIDRQKKRFEEMYKKVRSKGLNPRKRHTACSAAALGFPDTVMDMVRIGTAQFGMWPSPDIYNLHLLQTGKTKDAPLKRVLTWKTDIMHIKEIQKDEFVGYGTSFQASKEMRIAVIPIGYSNGYPRSQSNHGHVLISGKKCSVVGLINMNVFMVDVTHLPQAQVEDDVILIGRQKNNSISIRSFAEFTNAINNELVSRLPQVIPRIAVR